ncbi:MAG: hypothetical protein WC976_06170 [Caldisericia bacterium]
MNEHPILFSGEMVKALLAGKKTQTRRVMKPQPPEWCKDFGYTCFTPVGSISGRGVYEDKGPAEKFFKYRLGFVGDKLWVKETHYLYGKWVKNGKTKSGRQKYKFVCLKKAVKYFDIPPRKICKKKTEIGWFKRPSIFMFRWASRITLKITDIRVERLHDITVWDCLDEGILGNRDNLSGHTAISIPASEAVFDKFQNLWDFINGKKYPWSSNPFVWVIEFKRFKK